MGVGDQRGGVYGVWWAETKEIDKNRGENIIYIKYYSRWYFEKMLFSAEYPSPYNKRAVEAETYIMNVF